MSETFTRKQVADMFEVSGMAIHKLEKKGLIARIPSDDVKVTYSEKEVERLKKTWQPTRNKVAKLEKKRKAAEDGQSAAAVFAAMKQGLAFHDIVIQCGLPPKTVRHYMAEYDCTPDKLEKQISAAREEELNALHTVAKRMERKKEERLALRHKQQLEIERVKAEAAVKVAQIQKGVEDDTKIKIGSLLKR